MARPKSKGFTPKKGNFSIYVLVDGECEQDYLLSIKTVEPFKSILSSQKVKIAQDIPKTKSLDAQFNAVSEALDDYDRVFWIVDYDVIRKETLMQKKGTQTSLEKFSVLSKKFKGLTSLKKYKDKEAYVLINNPSIEFWYLLHYENTSKLYPTSEAVEKKLATHLASYTKNDEKFRKSIFSLLQANLENAIQNAKLLVQDDNDIQARADMYKIFEDNLKILKPSTEDI
ncbi:MAG: RloB family protein [Acinetobacter baumannii]|nr:RloB family protein [Acinetobacter baumannii]